MKWALWHREQREYNTDPQRRCYNGCHFSSEWVWSDWTRLYALPSKQEADQSAASWTTHAKPRRMQYEVREEA